MAPTTKAKAPEVAIRYSDDQLGEIMDKTPFTKWSEKLNIAEIKRATQLLSAAGAVSKREGKPVDYRELYDVLLEKSKNDAGARRALEAFDTLADYGAATLDSNQQYITIRVGKKRQGWMYVADNHRKNKATGKTEMTDFSEFDGKPVPTFPRR